MTHKVTLQKGDYVAVEDIKDDAEYHAIAQAFLSAGADELEYDKNNIIPTFWRFFGWCEDGLGHWDRVGLLEDKKRQLTPAQILGAGDDKWVPEVGEVCLINDNYYLCGCQPLALLKNDRVLVVDKVDVGYGPVCLIMDEEKRGSGTIIISGLSPLSIEEDRAVEDMADTIHKTDGLVSLKATAFMLAKALHAAGYRKQPVQSEGVVSEPANWREEDLLEWRSDTDELYTKGRLYKVELVEIDGMFLYMEDNEKGNHYWNFDNAVKHFTFHSRP